MTRIVLKHLSGSKANQIDEFPVPQFNELTLGRDSAVNVKYDPDRDDLVGRQHAKISADANDPQQFMIADLNSRNGTFVNKQRILGSIRLTPGDIVQFGAGGPEFVFDLEPRPAGIVKATREAATLQQPAAPATREQSASAAAGAPVFVQPATNSNPSIARPNGIGKATLERAIEQTKSDSRKTLYVGAAALFVVTALIIGGVTFWQRKNIQQVEGRNQSLEQDMQKANVRNQSLEKELTSVAAVANKTAVNVGADIAQRCASATVQIRFSWSLIHTPTGEKVYQQFVPNSYRTQEGQVKPLLENGAQAMGAFILVRGEKGDKIEPMLGLQKTSLPIASGGSGSGFVVTKDGLIVTNRHVAASWRSYYHHPRNAFPAVLLDGKGQPVLRNGVPIIFQHAGQVPQRWTPSETKQGNLKGLVGTPRLEGRNEYLNVVFAKTKQPFKGEIGSVSDQHDVATVKINAGTDLPTLQLNDNYDTIKLGDAAIVLGFPGASADPQFAVSQKDGFTDGDSVGVIPDPTLTVGRVTKLIRGKEGLGDKQIYADSDQYQLDIVATGAGNSGGPMFDENGKVIGIYFAGMNIEGDAAMSFAVPIRFANELLGPIQVIK